MVNNRANPRWGLLTLALVGVVMLARMVFLMWLSPYELSGDEAHYWEWSRRLDLSYYSKGPGVAWTIAASTRLLGHSEWAVRLPAVLFGAIGALAAAGLARRMVRDAGGAGGEGATAGAAGFFAAAAFCLLPPFQATALLMTIDGPYIAMWALAAGAGWAAAMQARAGRGWMAAGALCAAAVGVGFLFKYTALLIVPGLVGGAWFVVRDAQRAERDASGARRTAHGASWAVSGVVLAAFMLPVVVWNARHGWPTVSHLLGHLGLRGGDMAQKAARPWRYDPVWTLEFIGAQLAMVGPMAALMALAAWRMLRSADEGLRRAGLWCVWCAAPIMGFYLATTLFGKAQGNWPIAGYVTLVALVGVWLGAVRAVRTAHRAPRTPRLLWRASVVYGVVTGVGMLVLPAAAGLPVVGGLVSMDRISGQREVAAAVAGVMEREGATFVVAHRYDGASLLAFYLPGPGPGAGAGHPVVRSAASFMGDRRSAYDFFTDCSLNDPSLIGRDAVLVGGSEQRWARALRFDGFRDAGVVETRWGRRVPVRIGIGYRGPVTGADHRDDAGAETRP